MLKKIFKKRINEIYEKCESENILISDVTSNFLEQESLGVGKIRGNGVLLLTKRELYFGKWKPKREMLIPVKSIIEIKNPKSHLYRLAFNPLLKIILKIIGEELDSIAWYGSHLDKWNEIINKLNSKNKDN